jgi:hypothetical protein
MLLPTHHSWLMIDFLLYLPREASKRHKTEEQLSDRMPFLHGRTKSLNAYNYGRMGMYSKWYTEIKC